MENAYAATKGEFVVSSDINFRPVATHTGPDGCLYIVDMYRGMIQDAPWVNENMKAMLRKTGLNFNIKHGRIYRIVHDATPPAKPAKMLEMPTSELVSQLASENGWRRDTAQKLILLRDDRDEVKKTLIDWVANHEKPLARLHALWTLEGMGTPDAEPLVRVMGDSDWRLREAALRISEPLIRAGDKTLWAALPLLAQDADPCLLYTSPSPRDQRGSRMPSSA